jgi:Zn-dependent M28 family amino/carboxypeptidase
MVMKKSVVGLGVLLLVLVGFGACKTVHKPHAAKAEPNQNHELLLVQKELASDAFEGREAGKNQKAQRFILDYFNAIGLRKFNNSFAFHFDFEYADNQKSAQGTNLIGYIKGSKHPHKYIVIGAHYDHMGIKNGAVFNGADDNASGTAALLMLGKYFSVNPPEHTIVFAAFDAEEQGLYGSKAFVDNPPIPLANIILNLNMDMISRNPKNEIYVVGTYQYPQFRPLIDTVAQKLPLRVSYGHDDPNDKTKDYWMDSSDNGPFFKKNIPNITFSEEDHPGYHKPSDDFEEIHPTFYKNVFILIKRSLVKIDAHFPESPHD